MANNILVAFETKYGATQEIAQKISDVLTKAGLSTDILPISEAQGLAPYKAIILGSAVFTGDWRKEAAEFLETNEKALAEKIVWLFSSGPLGEGTVEENSKGWQFPKTLQPIADRIDPRDIAVFHGKVDVEKLSLMHKFMVKVAKVPVGDFRKWDDITSWAKEIADALKKENLS